MLIKAALVQGGLSVFDRELGRSLGFEKCVNLAQGSTDIKLSKDEAGTLRTIDAMRDDEQHWFNEVSEQLLYVHARAAVTLFDELLQRVFGEHLADHLPSRVLPISTDPPRDLDVLIDEEYSQISELLKPGRRARHEARARIRTLLAMGAHVEPDSQVSTRDVDRVEKGIKAGQKRADVFPRLGDVSTAVEGLGATVRVHITRKDGAPVRYTADESVPAAAIREVDLNRKFYLSPSELATKLGLTPPKSTCGGISASTTTRRSTTCSPWIAEAQSVLRWCFEKDEGCGRRPRHGCRLGGSQANGGPEEAKKRVCTVPGCATTPAPKAAAARASRTRR